MNALLSAYSPVVPTVAAEYHVSAATRFTGIITEDSLKYSFALRDHQLYWESYGRTDVFSRVFGKPVLTAVQFIDKVHTYTLAI